MKPVAIDALLGNWPAQDPQEKGGNSWDERADAIVKAALSLKDRGSPESIETLLAAPGLEPEPGEEKATNFQLGGNAQPMSNENPSQSKRPPSLKELAARASQAGANRASVTPLPPAVRSSAPPPSPPASATVTPISKAKAARASDAGREDSGVLRLADLQAKEAEKAEAAAAAAEAALASIAAKRADNQQNAPVIVPAKPAANTGKSSTGMWAGAAIAVFGIAAAFAVYQTRKPEPEPPKVEAHVTEQPQNEPAARALPKPVETGELAAIASSEPAPAVTAAPKIEDDKGDPAAGAGGPTAPAPSVVAGNDPTPASTEKPLKGSKVGTLDEEMKKAVGADDLPAAPQDDGSKPAAGGGGNIPEQPSQGNAQAAIRAVLPGAKACVAGATEPTSANVTFGSSGSVQSVSVSGWAASNGKAACVKSALQGARVSPFAKPTFTAPVMVRP